MIHLAVQHGRAGRARYDTVLYIYEIRIYWNWKNGDKSNGDKNFMRTAARVEALHVEYVSVEV